MTREGLTEEQKREAAATLIQAAFRRFKAERAAITERDKKTAAATAIQAAWRGKKARDLARRLREEKKLGGDPVEEREKMIRKNPEYEGRDLTNEELGKIIDRVGRAKERIAGSKKNDPLLREDNPLDLFTGYIKHNQITGSDFPHDHIERNSHDVSYDISGWGGYNYQQSLNRTFFPGVEISHNKEEGTPQVQEYQSLIGYSQFIKFTGSVYTDESYKDGEKTGTRAPGNVERTSELLYVDKHGKLVRIIGPDQELETGPDGVPRTLIQQKNDNVEKRNELTTQELNLLNKIALGEEIPEYWNPVKTRVSTLLNDYFNGLGEEETKEIPITQEELQDLLEKNPTLKNKVELEIKAFVRKEFRDRSHHLLASENDNTQLEGEDRYKALKAINEDVNREYSREFINGKLAEQSKMLEGQSGALESFAKNLRGSNPGFEDPTKFPIANAGVAISSEYNGRGVKVVKVSFNNCRESKNPKNLIQRIEIEGSAASIAIRFIPKGCEGFYYKDGKKITVPPSDDEDRTFVDENTIFMRKVAPEPGSNPLKYVTSYESYPVLENRKGFLVTSSKLRQDVQNSTIDFIKKSVKKLELNAISAENGIIQSAAMKASGQITSTKSVTQSDIAKDLLSPSQERIATLISMLETSTEEEQRSLSSQLSSEIAAHEANLNKMAKKGMATTKHVNRLIKALGGGTELYTVYETDTRIISAKDEMNRISTILRNPTLKDLDLYATNVGLNQKPSVQQFRRQVARYAVLRANHIDKRQVNREAFLAKVFKLANDHLSAQGVELDRGQFNNELLQEMKDYATALGDKRYSFLNGFKLIGKEEGRAKNAMGKALGGGVNETLNLEQAVVNAYRKYDREVDESNTASTATTAEYKRAVTALNEDEQNRYTKSSKQENSFRRIFPGDVPEIPNGYTTSRTDAVTRLGEIFDSHFSQDMRNLFGNDNIDRPDVNEFARSVARYAVEAAQHRNLSFAYRASTLEGVMKLANDELTNHGITVNRAQFTKKLRDNIKAYAELRKKESSGPATWREDGYKAIGEKRLIQAQTKFESEKGGYKLALAELESKCLNILLSYHYNNEIFLQDNDWNSLTSLPESSIEKVMEVYKKTTNQEVRKITTDTGHTNSEISARNLKGKIFARSKISAHPSREEYEPIDTVNNPIHYMQTRQFSHEMGKWIVDVSQSEYSKPSERGVFIEKAINTAVESLAKIPGKLELEEGELETQLKESIGEYALEKKGKLWSVDPSQPKAKLANIASKVKVEQPTTKKWVNHVKAKKEAEAAVRGGGASAA